MQKVVNSSFTCAKPARIVLFIANPYPNFCLTAVIYIEEENLNSCHKLFVVKLVPSISPWAIPKFSWTYFNIQDNSEIFL